MACACTGCINKRNYYLWLRDTVEESGMKIPGSLQFDPWSVSNSKLDSAINRMLKLYRKAVVIIYDLDTAATTSNLPSWELAPWDWEGLKRKLS